MPNNTIANNTVAVRSLIIYGLCLPLALLLGYWAFSAVDDFRYDKTPLYMIGAVLFLMVLPLFMRWYHAWLIMAWQSAVLFYFLPGQLQGWFLMSVIGFGIAVGHYIVNRERRFIHVPSVAYPLIFIALVVVVTAKFRGGIGLHVFGDEEIGGKRYFYIWVAILGYFAMTSQAIAPDKRKLMAVLFMLSGATAIISDIGGLIGGPFRYIGLIFPLTDSSTFVQQREIGVETVERFGGIGEGCSAAVFTFLIYYGIEETLNLRKLWRPLLFIAVLFLSTLGGFRTTIIFTVMLFAFLFYFEGLLRSRLMPIVVLGIVLLGSLIVAFPRHFPMTFQRCVAFLPIDVDPVARMSAEASSTWRVEMWKSVLPDVPRYLWLGKGLGIDLEDLASYYYYGSGQVGGAVGGGFNVSGDYHNGPLSLIIQFGIWGVIGFLWFLVAAVRVLWRNFKYGDPDVKRINAFLLAFFLAKTALFFFVFGGFYSDMMTFVGLVGFSISTNGGVAEPVSVVQRQFVFNRFRPLPPPALT